MNTDETTQDFIAETAAAVERAVLGKQFEDFMSSDMGKYLDKRMEQEYMNALEALQSVDATDARAVMQVQSDAARARGMREWFERVIIDGLEATKVLESRDN